jgi:antitoxin component YwqK of YwqJK toxin-antitoxin module
MAGRPNFLLRWPTGRQGLRNFTFHREHYSATPVYTGAGKSLALAASAANAPIAKETVAGGRSGGMGRNYVSPTVGWRDHGGSAGLVIATTTRQGIDMKRFFFSYPLASGCVALALAMAAAPAAHAEGHGKLRVPATLPIPLLSDIAATEYSEVKAEPGVTGEVELVRERYADGKVRVERQVTLNGDGNYVNHGAWKMYSPAGDVIAEGQYKFGERDGMWTRWNGRNDSPSLGEFPFNHFKAPFMSQATFANGKMEGDWIITDANDKKVMMITFKAGQRNGQATTWQPNGKILKQVAYQNGIPAGDLLEANPKTGEIARTATYEEGRKVTTKTTYFPGSRKKQSEIMYLAAKTVESTPDDYWTIKLAKYGSEGGDMRHGTSKSWYANGKPEQDGSYEYGKKSGTFTFWHENGQVASTGEYKDDLAEGNWVWWHANGQKSAIGKYQKGTLIGEWRWWDEAGKLTKQQNYTGTEQVQTEPTEVQPTAKQPTEAQLDVSKRNVHKTSRR